MFKGPADIAVEEVHTILRQIVFRTLESEDCKALAQYTHLKREIAQTAAATLGAVPLRPGTCLTCAICVDVCAWKSHCDFHAFPVLLHICV